MNLEQAPGKIVKVFFTDESDPFSGFCIYYKGTLVSAEELACKEIINHLHTDHPTWGARQMSAQLKKRGYNVGRCKAR